MRPMERGTAITALSIFSLQPPRYLVSDSKPIGTLLGAETAIIGVIDQ